MSAYSVPTFTASGSISSSSSSSSTNRNSGMIRDTCRYAPIGPINRNRIAYFYDDEVAGIHYGKSHPMKPQRMALTNELIMHYGLHERMEIYEPRWATEEEIKQFHVADYVDFLRQVTPENKSAFKEHIERFNVGEDCPIFHDLYKFCRISAGGSIEAASRINTGYSDIAINWSGGLHHAKKVSASGFCYVNDIVLAILELLRYHQRVVYIDIDVHHGDGVQEAFYNSNRVMTVSFHRYGSSADGPDFFFPGTGGLHETGVGAGQYYSVNVPLKAGMDDNTYVALFQSVMDKVMLSYRPGAVVLQCGADSLGCDRIGCFCLSIKGHGRCVEYMKRYNVPMVVLGGGGYTVRNVARCWAYETAILVNATLPNSIPEHEFKHYYAPDFSLFPKIDNQLRNENTPQDLSNIRFKIFEALRNIEHAPSVQALEIPPPLSITSTEQSIAAYRDREAARIADLSIREREQVLANARYYENDFYGNIQDQDQNEVFYEDSLTHTYNGAGNDMEVSSVGSSQNLNGSIERAATTTHNGHLKDHLLGLEDDTTDEEISEMNGNYTGNNGGASLASYENDFIARPPSPPLPLRDEHVNSKPTEQHQDTLAPPHTHENANAFVPTNEEPDTLEHTNTPHSAPNGNSHSHTNGHSEASSAQNPLLNESAFPNEQVKPYTNGHHENAVHQDTQSAKYPTHNNQPDSQKALPQASDNVTNAVDMDTEIESNGHSSVVTHIAYPVNEKVHIEPLIAENAAADEPMI